MRGDSSRAKPSRSRFYRIEFETALPGITWRIAEVALRNGDKPVHAGDFAEGNTVLEGTDEPMPEAA